MNIEHIVTFLKVYQVGSFQQAANQLYLPQPTVSHRISQLEKELGNSLLIRAKGKIKLTEEGKAFLPYARSIIGAVQEGKEAVGQVKSGTTGKLSIGCNSSFASCILPQMMNSFTSKHANVSIKVYCYSTSELVRLMKSRTFQLGITRYTSNDPDLNYRLVYSEPMMLYVSPQHRFAKHKKIALEEVLQEPLITYQKDTQSRKLIDVTLNQLNLNYKPKFESNNLSLLKHFIQMNFGVLFSGPSYMKSEVKKNELVQIEIEHNPFPLSQLFIVYREGELNSLDQLFIRHFEDEINDQSNRQTASTSTSSSDVR
ncbi:MULTISPECIES: LysR family transcriptional regulator [unclassified Paenibacillus]|uniref:LysR family transcriptional regulator n=1 Tax=unclassified Paenibacillus TaxID=185978 RepID=UPI001AE42B8E|nr:MULTISPECIES: LysR family transcriptional regulator [unclassified Paenibacillus]MBP1156422.1 DNA-binding transcriptional LysR family regulator [Paenibacillus sp. PvP091]MBP1168192.1 DNA-binding transcriptional LysR family regulator [Paenibacillus sp. PvR098]MBP2439220.1 DNA-binding transcriptional LysR family regulator [Paenibacillus sp. PvP052]